MCRCFGFDTAVEEAQRALLAAKVEAGSARKGIGLVKLMGRQSGFIAMQASMASAGPWGSQWTSGILDLYTMLAAVAAVFCPGVMCAVGSSGSSRVDVANVQACELCRCAAGL